MILSIQRVHFMLGRKIHFFFLISVNPSLSTTIQFKQQFIS